MKTIKLTQGKETIVDDEDYEYLSQWKWYYHNGYATRSTNRINGIQTTIRLHKLLTSLKEEVDHINGNRLDNRKDNLRICSRKENSRNQIKRNNTSSKYKGVSWNKRNQKWMSFITYNYKRIHLGYFYNEIDAAKAYNKAAIKYHKEFAKLNNI